MCRGRCFGVDIHSFKLNRVLLRIRAFSRRSNIFYFCIGSQHFKCITRKNFHSSSCPSASLPLLNFPVAKYFSTVSRRFRRCSCRCQCTINIGMSICRCSCAAVSIVFDYNSRCAIKRGTPLSIDIQFLSDPETITSVISNRIRIELRFNQVTVSIISVCHINRLVIVRCNVAFINRISFTVEHSSARFIKIPANKLISCQLSGRFTYMSAFTDTEIQFLISSPVDIAGCAIRIIRMQEYTVLFLTPLRIYCDSAFRH